MNSKSSMLSIGIIIGNRDFFPDSLVEKARVEIIEVFSKLNLKPILLDSTDTKLGGVETFKQAQKCTELFKKHANEIVGVLVLLPIFTDEKGVADTLKLSNLNVPVLIQAYPDELTKMNVVNTKRTSGRWRYYGQWFFNAIFGKCTAKTGY
ncbi:hypothetical protein Q2T41_19765 [Maribacter confluentis]|uniref:Fucose isomerase n=1 Tax=Maribacter confluentis TaxID=1656093 RepID=A0ABT8RVC9_9FLAO|nr:hypothetical protein [Maribacter confluentis]MDO1513414.1 hypothetical protein [Maribacter confluentis]MDO1514864.1 hypothetical protein [Maribacter confluentis]